jgi:hypothetical protein
MLEASVPSLARFLLRRTESREVLGGMNARRGILAAILVLGAQPAMACSPIVPLSILYSGPTIGAMVLGAGAGLALVIAVKCGVFAALCRQLHPTRAMSLMLLANGVTTILGIVLAVAPASGGPLLVVTVPVVVWMSIRAADSLEHRPYVAGALIALFLLSFHIWGLAEYAGGASHPGAAYWGLKFAYTACAVTVSFVMTASWEAYLVRKWTMPRARPARVGAGRRRPRIAPALEESVRVNEGAASRQVLRAAFWANAVTFGIVAVAGALVALPARLESPDFLLFVAKMLTQTFA